MAGGSSDNNDGSDIFWPGFVDATTNLILNLLFLLTILIVAVFMFALELGRAIGPQDANADHSSKVEEVVEGDPIQENVALKKEIERLKLLLDSKRGPTGTTNQEVKSLAGTSAVPKPEHGLKETQAGDFELMVRFNDEAVSFQPAEREKLLVELEDVAKKDMVLILVEVPAGFSEAKRMGFYRALAVRNLLMELNVPPENIDVSVVEGTAGGNASVVKVKSR